MPEPLEPAQAPLNQIQKSILENEVIEAIRQVFDPEIPINVYDLGLIYEIRVEENSDVHIIMTLTSPMCPVAETLPGEVEVAARGAAGVRNVTVELTWDPPFTLERMSEEAKLVLGFM